ncbi:hypothetical protein HDU67_005063, partial [Dinochytrium kinnereticum]
MIGTGYRTMREKVGKRKFITLASKMVGVKCHKHLIDYTVLDLFDLETSTDAQFPCSAPQRINPRPPAVKGQEERTKPSSASPGPKNRPISENAKDSKPPVFPASQVTKDANSLNRLGSVSKMTSEGAIVVALNIMCEEQIEAFSEWARSSKNAGTKAFTDEGLGLEFRTLKAAPDTSLLEHEVEVDKKAGALPPQTQDVHGVDQANSFSSNGLVNEDVNESPQ